MLLKHLKTKETKKKVVWGVLGVCCLQWFKDAIKDFCVNHSEVKDCILFSVELTCYLSLTEGLRTSSNGKDIANAQYDCPVVLFRIVCQKKCWSMFFLFRCKTLVWYSFTLHTLCMNASHTFVRNPLCS
jgi:hypothetical protein